MVVLVPEEFRAEVDATSAEEISDLEVTVAHCVKLGIDAPGVARRLVAAGWSEPFATWYARTAASAASTDTLPVTLALGAATLTAAGAREKDARYWAEPGPFWMGILALAMLLELAYYGAFVFAAANYGAQSVAAAYVRVGWPSPYLARILGLIGMRKLAEARGLNDTAFGFAGFVSPLFAFLLVLAVRRRSR